MACVTCAVLVQRRARRERSSLHTSCIGAEELNRPPRKVARDRSEEGLYAAEVSDVALVTPHGNRPVRLLLFEKEGHCRLQACFTHITEGNVHVQRQAVLCQRQAKSWCVNSMAARVREHVRCPCTRSWSGIGRTWLQV